MTGDDRQAMTIRLPGPLHERLRRAAFESRTPMNQIAVDAIGAAIAVREKEQEEKR